MMSEAEKDTTKKEKSEPTRKPMKNTTSKACKAVQKNCTDEASSRLSRIYKGTDTLDLAAPIINLCLTPRKLLKHKIVLEADPLDF